MTRAHATLLGPCFKTGPESTQSYSAADGRVQSLFGNTNANSRSASRSAQVRRTNNRPRLRWAERELVAALRLRPTVEQSAGTSRVRTNGRNRRTGSTASRRPTPNGSRRPTGGEVHAFAAQRRTQGAAVANDNRLPSGTRALRGTLNLLCRTFGFLRFTPKRFHVLLNSLFKVLFNFPSRYLFAIGLVVLFSLRWSLPPT